MNQVKRELQQDAPSAIPQQIIAQVSQQVTTQYKGALPPPEMLREFNDIVPNGAERIVAMAEKQLDHRLDLEKTVIKGDSKRSWWGLWLGFASTIVVTGAGVSVALIASPVAGATIITSTLVSLAAVFVFGQWSRRAEREHKANLMAGRK